MFRISLHTAGKMGLMICLGQGGLHFLSALWSFLFSITVKLFCKKGLRKPIYHTIIRAAFVCLSVCLFVCSPTPPRSFDGSSPNLVGICRWTSELPLRGSFWKRSTGQTSLFRSRRNQAETTPLQTLLPSTASFATSKSLIPSTGIFTSIY